MRKQKQRTGVYKQMPLALRAFLVLAGCVIAAYSILALHDGQIVLVLSGASFYSSATRTVVDTWPGLLVSGVLDALFAGVLVFAGIAPRKLDTSGALPIAVCLMFVLSFLLVFVTD